MAQSDEVTVRMLGLGRMKCSCIGNKVASFKGLKDETQLQINLASLQLVDIPHSQNKSSVDKLDLFP